MYDMIKSVFYKFQKFVFLSIALVGVTAILEMNTKHVLAQEKPYKAASVDECIQEKECVWHIFSKQLSAGYLPSSYKRDYIIKWNTPIQLVVTGNKAQKFLNEIVSLSNQLAPVFPYTISVNPQSNFVIVVTDDVEG